LEQQLAFEETCERYLLGELSKAEREQFEESYFADDALFDRFLAVKDELLDAYARGELAEEKRTRFAQHFLATAPRRQQLDETQEFIRAVTAFSTKKDKGKAMIAVASGGLSGRQSDAVGTALPAMHVPSPMALGVTTDKSSWWKSLVDFFKLRSFALPTALAAALLLILFSGALVMIQFQTDVVRLEVDYVYKNIENNNIAPSPVPATHNSSAANTNIAVKSTSKNPANNNQTPTNTNAASSNPTPKSPTDREPPVVTVRPPTHIASIMLLPVASRDINKANTLQLSSDTRAVRVGLSFKNDDYRNYNAKLTTVAGASVWQQKTLKADIGGANKSVTLQFAPALLRQQDYIVTLTGQTAAGQTETIGEYYFRVERSSSQNKQTQTPQP